MTATIANVDAALKDDYQALIREQLVHAWQFLSQIESNSKDVYGRAAVLSLHISRNSGVGARAASAALPAAGNQGYVEERVPIKRNYASIAIDGDLIEASASDRGAFARMLQAEMDGALTDMKRDVNRQLFNDSTKAIVVTDANAAVAQIDLDAATTDVQLRQLSKGMRVDIGTTVNYQASESDVEILSIDKTAVPPTITFTAPVTTLLGDLVTRQGSDGNELTGLREIVRDDGILFGVDSSTEESWRSFRGQGVGGGVGFNSGATRVPTELLFEEAIETIHFDSDMEPNMICTTRGVRRNYAAQLQGQRRYMDNVKIQGGFSAVTVAAGNTELPLVVDNDSPNNAAFLVNTKYLCQHQMGSPWSFLDRDGSVLHLVSGFDRYEATIYNYHELTTDHRNAHGVVEDLTEA